MAALKGDARLVGGVRERRKTRKRQEGESVERAVGHIIKGIRLSEYFRDTIKRLLYGDRELSALFVSSRYPLSRLPSLPPHCCPEPERPGNRLHSHPVPPSSIPCNVARSHRCNLPVRTQYPSHPHGILRNEDMVSDGFLCSQFHQLELPRQSGGGQATVCPFIMHLDLPFLFESYSFLVPVPLFRTASFEPASQLSACLLSLQSFRFFELEVQTSTGLSLDEITRCDPPGSSGQCYPCVATVTLGVFVLFPFFDSFDARCLGQVFALDLVLLD